MTNAERNGYFTNGQTAAAKRWAKAELKRIAPTIRATNNYQLKEYAEKLLGVIEGWLAINEDEHLMTSFTNSLYSI